MHAKRLYNAIDGLCPIDAVICVLGPPMCCCNIWAFGEGPDQSSQTYKKLHFLLLTGSHSIFKMQFGCNAALRAGQLFRNPATTSRGLLLNSPVRWLSLVLKASKSMSQFCQLDMLLHAEMPCSQALGRPSDH